MCEFCSGSSKISRTIELNEKKDMSLSIRHDAEHPELLKFRVELGSLGYTLPVKANYCFMCGKKIKEYKTEYSEINN